MAFIVLTPAYVAIPQRRSLKFFLSSV